MRFATMLGVALCALLSQPVAGQNGTLPNGDVVTPSGVIQSGWIYIEEITQSTTSFRVATAPYNNRYEWRRAQLYQSTIRKRHRTGGVLGPRTTQVIRPAPSDRLTDPRRGPCGGSPTLCDREIDPGPFCRRPPACPQHQRPAAHRDDEALARDGAWPGPPAGPLAQAIRHALERWPALIRFLDDGRIELDNNPVERATRPIGMDDSLCNPSSSICKHWKHVFARRTTRATLSGEGSFFTRSVSKSAARSWCGAPRTTCSAASAPICIKRRIMWPLTPRCFAASVSVNHSPSFSADR
jgi:hypothetical protein